MYRVISKRFILTFFIQKTHRFFLNPETQFLLRKLK